MRIAQACVKLEALYMANCRISTEVADKLAWFTLSGSCDREEHITLTLNNGSGEDRA